MKSLASPVFNLLKALEFGAFFACFHLFRYLKVVQLCRQSVLSVECVVRGVCCQLSVLSVECIVSGVLSVEYVVSVR